jgi:hypothetical protein
MKYMLLIYSEEEMDPGTPIDQAALDAYWEVDKEARQKGQLIMSEALQTTANATSVRVRGGKVHTTDGPFAETKERLGGLYLLDCRDLDEAIAYAAKIPGSHDGTIEVRPVMGFEAPAWVNED